MKPEMIEVDFKNVMHKAGVLIKDQIIADGKLHRFHVDGDKKNSKNGGTSFLAMSYLRAITVIGKPANNTLGVQEHLQS